MHDFGVIVLAYLGIGLFLGTTHVTSYMAFFFSAGFQVRRMVGTIITFALLWPLAIAVVLMGLFPGVYKVQEPVSDLTEAELKALKSLAKSPPRRGKRATATFG